MTILNEIYASAPPGDDLLLTLSITSSEGAFDSLDIAEADGVIRLARSFEDVNITSGPTYRAAGIAIQRPERSVAGRQDLVFQLDNVSGQVLEAIQAAQSAGGTTLAELRVWRWQSLVAGGEVEGPIILRIVGARVTKQSARIDCAFGDLANVNWNRLKYKTSWTPGLAYW